VIRQTDCRLQQLRRISRKYGADCHCGDCGSGCQDWTYRAVRVEMVTKS